MTIIFLLMKIFKSVVTVLINAKNFYSAFFTPDDKTAKPAVYIGDIGELLKALNQFRWCGLFQQRGNIPYNNIYYRDSYGHILRNLDEILQYLISTYCQLTSDMYSIDPDAIPNCFFCITKKEEWKLECKEILEVALVDSDQWVSMLAKLLKSYPSTGLLNYQIEENASVFTDVANDLKKLVRKHSSQGLLLLECLYLNRNALIAVVEQLPQLEKHFILKQKPKSATRLAELLQKSVDAVCNLRKSTTVPSVPIRWRGLIKALSGAIKKTDNREKHHRKRWTVKNTVQKSTMDISSQSLKDLLPNFKLVYPKPKAPVPEEIPTPTTEDKTDIPTDKPKREAQEKPPAKISARNFSDNAIDAVEQMSSLSCAMFSSLLSASCIPLKGTPSRLPQSDAKSRINLLGRHRVQPVRPLGRTSLGRKDGGIKADCR